MCLIVYNYKCSLVFKNSESLCCTPETNNIVHQVYVTDFLKILNEKEYVYQDDFSKSESRITLKFL